MVNDKYKDFQKYDELILNNSDIMLTMKTKEIMKRKLMRENLEEYFFRCNKDVYIKKEFIYKWCQINNNVIECDLVIIKIENYLLEKLSYKLSLKKIKRILKEKVNVFSIMLFNKEIEVIEKEQLDLIFNGIDYIKENECINRKELVDKINNAFKGLNFGITEKNIFKFIQDKKLEVLDDKFIGNFYSNRMSLYPKKTVNKVVTNIKDIIKSGKVRLVNISFEEYFSLTDEKFSEFMVLDINKFKETSEINEDRWRFKNIYRTFKNTDVKVIWINKVTTYVSIKEYEDFIEFKKNYVGSGYFEEFGIKLRRVVAENNGIQVKTYKENIYISRNDIDKYLKISFFNNEYSKAMTVYDKVLIKIKYFPNENEGKYPKLMLHLFSFIKYISRSNRTFGCVAPLYSMYDLILNNIKRDLDIQNEEDNNRLFSKIIKIAYGKGGVRRIIIQFNNFLINNRDFKLNRITDIKEKIDIEPYKEEQFINLLTKLIEIFADKNELKKLYRDWNISSVISYIFIHYCVAWRKSDLVKKLPKPNLRIIGGIKDGEDFIKWLEDGNELDEKVAYDICKGIEETTNRLRLKAGKNDMDLCCVIPEVFNKEVATLLCINEANREIHFNKSKHFRDEEVVFNKQYLQHNKMNPLLIETFNINLEEILGDGFHNTRMNKGFLTLVKEKAEELNLAYSYYYAQVARGHRPIQGKLAETTKIYLQKDISKASVMAFSTGTMGSIAYTLLELVDSEFENKYDKDKIKDIKKLNMTPYTIENNIKVISNKIAEIKNEMNNYFNRGGNKEGLLKDILYGQKVYGIEEKTKCLLKITRDNEFGITRITSKNYEGKRNSFKWCPYNRKTCIGCPYMIALRYFIYEFEKKFNQVINDLEEARTKIDKEIAIENINNVYIPALNDLYVIVGEEINNIIDIDRYIRLSENI